jgi:polyribonucleotide 5'-hydroxyl-kinase
MENANTAQSTALDIPNRKMTLLAPSAGSFVGKTAVIGSFEWADAL